MRYKWAEPSEWLAEKIVTSSKQDLIHFLNAFIDHAETDEDTIQLLFQSQMVADGYFEEEEEHAA